MKSKSVALTLLSCLILLSLVLTAQQPPDPAPPQDPQQPSSVTLVLPGGGQARKMKLAIPAFRGPGQMTGEAATSSSPATSRSRGRTSSRGSD